MGSGLYSYVTTGEIKSQGTSVTEGIGIMRITANFRATHVDEAFQIDDKLMMNMLYHVAKHDGLLVGTSSALNLASAYSLGKRHQDKGKKIVTFLCDHGRRYASRVFNDRWLTEKGLFPEPLA
jgi:cysteine synthase A